MPTMQTVCESFHTTVRSSTAVYSVLYKSTTKLLTYTHTHTAAISHAISDNLSVQPLYTFAIGERSLTIHFTANSKIYKCPPTGC